MSGVIDLGGNIEILQGPGGTTPPAGTVTQVNTGTGLTGGPITSTGTISIASVSLTNQVLGVLPVANGGTQWVSSSTAIYYNTGLVGIGVIPTTSSLEVSGTGIAATLTRNVATANTPRGVSLIVANNTTGSNSGDGHGPVVVFQNSNSSAAATSLADIGGVRSGGDATGDLVFRPYVAATPTERMRITSAGRVGIGTSTPQTALDIVGGSITVEGDASGAFAASANGIHLVFNSSTSIGRLLSIQNGSGWRAMQIDGSVVAFNTSSGGTFAIGSTSAATQLLTTGSVRFANFGSGAATFDANGNISSVSDEDLKDIQNMHTDGLDALLNINPIHYKWKEMTGFDTENVYVGFSAQNIQSSLGEKAIGKATCTFGVDSVASLSSPDQLSEAGDIAEPIEKEKPKQYLSIQDRAIMATMVNAIKELAQRVADLENR